MKMQEIVNASPALRKLATQELDIRTAYKVSRLVRSLDEHLEFHDRKYNEILEKHCDLKEDKYFPKSPEHNAALRNERDELLDLDVDIGEVKKVTISADEKITLSAVDLMALESFVEVEFEGENTNA